MKIKTRDFGEIELDETKTIEFVQPIFGFEGYHRFCLLFDEEIGPHITWLQSMDEPGLCFILIDPDSIQIDYLPILPIDVEKELGEGEYVCWVMAVIRDSIKTASVNLKSPILVNMKTKRGMQIILEQDYPVRFALSGEVKQEEC